MGNFYMESTQINYRRDEKLKTVDQKLQELSETSAIDTDIAPVFKSTSTYHPGDMVYYRNKLYVFNVEHTGAWAAADVTATDVTTELSSLKSGLTNVDAALSVPENTGKNVLPLTLASLKAINSVGTWADNVYTKNSISFTVNANANGYVTSIVVNGTADVAEDTTFNLITVTALNGSLDGAYILNGCPSGGDNDYHIYIGSDVKDKGSGASFNTPLTGTYSGIRVKSDYTANNLTFYPMIRLSSVSDPTFAPYIPSVESRIEAVESGLDETVKYYQGTISSASVTANSPFDVATLASLGLSGKTILGINCYRAVGDTTRDYAISVMLSGDSSKIVCNPTVTQTNLACNYTVFYV